MSNDTSNIIRLFHKLLPQDISRDINKEAGLADLAVRGALRFGGRALRTGRSALRDFGAAGRAMAPHLRRVGRINGNVFRSVIGSLAGEYAPSRWPTRIFNAAQFTLDSTPRIGRSVVNAAKDGWSAMGPAGKATSLGSLLAGAELHGRWLGSRGKQPNAPQAYSSPYLSPSSSPYLSPSSFPYLSPFASQY